MSHPTSRVTKAMEINRVIIAGRLFVNAATNLKPENDKEGNPKGFHCDQYASGYGMPIEIDGVSYGIYVTEPMYNDLYNNTKGLEYIDAMVEGKLTPGNDVYNGKSFVYPIVVDADNIIIVKKQEI